MKIAQTDSTRNPPSKKRGLRGGLAAAMLLAIFLITLTAQSGPGPVDAAVNTTVRFSADPAADSWDFANPGNGQQTWSFELYNHAGEPNTVPQTFSAPTITVANAVFPSITGPIYPLPFDPTLPPPAVTTSTFPLTYSGTFVGPVDSVAPPPAFGFGWGSTDHSVIAASGFSASRTVNPLVIPAGATVQQIVTLTVIPVDATRYTSGVGLPFVSASMGISGACVQVVPATAGCSPGGANLSVNAPALGVPQTLTATIEVTNSLPYPVMSKPWTTSQMNTAPIPTVSSGTTTTISDPSLGDVTFSLGESVVWHPRDPNVTYIVDLPGLFVQANDTTPPVILPTVSGPSAANGWYTGPVTVTWALSDPESGIASSSGCGASTVTGTSVVTCSATNGAGLTNAASISIQIDPIAPSVSGMPGAACSLWPPNNALVSVGTISPAAGASGVASFSVVGSSNEPAGAEPNVVITGTGLQPRAVQLRAQRLGSGNGRVYTLTATVVNGAGVTTRTTTSCVVPHDQGK